MSEPFLSEIRMVSFNFPPKGWALCNGQLLPINQNQALFSLLGTTYGGNGQTTFALPDLRGRTAVHFSNAYHPGPIGRRGSAYADRRGNGGSHTLGTGQFEPRQCGDPRGQRLGPAGDEPV